MNRFATLLVGSALTSLIASYGFAADAAPDATKSAATSTAAPAALSAPAAPAAASPAAPQAAPLATAAGAADVKIGYINMNKVATESAQGKAATAKLSDKSDKTRKKLEAKQKQLEKHKKEIEAKLPTMTPKERAAKGAEFQKKMEDFQKLVRSSELEVMEYQDKLTADMYQKIKDATVQFAKDAGYALIVEEKSVLYALDTLKPTNVTDEVIEVLGKKPTK